MREHHPRNQRRKPHRHLHQASAHDRYRQRNHHEVPLRLPRQPQLRRDRRMRDPIGWTARISFVEDEW